MTKREAIFLASCAFIDADGDNKNGTTVKEVLCLAETYEKQTKKCNIFLLYVFMNKCLAKDGSTKVFTENFKKRSKNPEKQTKSQVGKKKKS